MNRLKEARHPFRDRHLAYSGAGHIISVPNAPAASNFFVRWGGDPEDIAAAAADAWPQNRWVSQPKLQYRSPLTGALGTMVSASPSGKFGAMDGAIDKNRSFLGF